MTASDSLGSRQPVGCGNPQQGIWGFEGPFQLKTLPAWPQGGLCPQLPLVCLALCWMLHGHCVYSSMDRLLHTWSCGTGSHEK